MLETPQRSTLGKEGSVIHSKSLVRSSRNTYCNSSNSEILDKEEEYNRSMSKTERIGRASEKNPQTSSNNDQTDASERSSSRCPSKRRGRRASFRGASTGDDKPVQSLMNDEIDDKNSEFEDDAFLFNGDSHATAKTSTTTSASKSSSNSSSKGAREREPQNSRRGVARTKSTDTADMILKSPVKTSSRPTAVRSSSPKSSPSTRRKNGVKEGGVSSNRRSSKSPSSRGGARKSTTSTSHKKKESQSSEGLVAMPLEKSSTSRPKRGKTLRSNSRSLSSTHDDDDDDDNDEVFDNDQDDGHDLGEDSSHHKSSYVKDTKYSVSAGRSGKGFPSSLDDSLASFGGDDDTSTREDDDDPSSARRQRTSARRSSTAGMPRKKSLTNGSTASSRRSSTSALGNHFGSSHKGDRSSPTEDDDMTESSEMLDDLHAKRRHRRKSVATGGRASSSHHSHSSSASKRRGSNDSDRGAKSSPPAGTALQFTPSLAQDGQAMRRASYVGDLVGKTPYDGMLGGMDTETEAETDREENNNNNNNPSRSRQRLISVSDFKTLETSLSARNLMEGVGDSATAETSSPVKTLSPMKIKRVEEELAKSVSALETAELESKNKKKGLGGFLGRMRSTTKMGGSGKNGGDMSDCESVGSRSSTRSSSSTSRMFKSAGCQHSLLLDDGDSSVSESSLLAERQRGRAR